MQIVAALVWPALALVFAGALFGLWYLDRTRRHLLSFSVGFLALFISMTVIIAFPSYKSSYLLAFLHALSCISVMAIAWGAVARLNQRMPLLAMSVLTLISCLLLFLALENKDHEVALITQNGAAGLLFGIGAVSLWTARSTNFLDRMLVWTLSLISAFSILRPLLLFYLQVEVEPMVERAVELNAVNLVVLTVLTVVLGIILVTIAIQEAIEIRHGAERSDPVSGFLDQRTFENNCERALVKAHRLDMPVAIAVLHFDWFQQVTKKWGADTTDMVIREICDIVRSWQRESDVIGRVAEDQFAILFVGMGAGSAEKTVRKLRDEVDEACNERMSGLLKFTLSSSILEARAGMGFKVLMRDALTPLQYAGKLGANISFVNGIEKQLHSIDSSADGTFVAHG